MIPPGSLSEESLVLRELLLVRERDAVNSLQGIVVLITEEVRSRILGSSSESEPLFLSSHAFGDALW